MKLKILMIEPPVESMIFRKLFGQPIACQYERLSFRWNEDKQDRHGFFEISGKNRHFYMANSEATSYQKIKNKRSPLMEMGFSGVREMPCPVFWPR
jgi:hypothetical protein